MKCNKCGAEWKVDASRSASITVCPFCQEQIVIEKSSGWQYFDNTKDLLAYVAVEYGSDALFGRKYFSDHTAPSMPQGQKNLVKQAFDCGAVIILQDNMDSDQAHKEIAVKQAVKRLTDLMFLQEAAERVIWEITNAIGWGMPEPQIQSSQSAPPPPPPRKTQPAAQSAVPGIGALMTRAWQFAEDGDWKESADYFNKVLDSDPSYAPAFLGLLCVDLKAPKEDKLANTKDPGSITNHKYYKRAAADPAVKARLDDFIQTINARIDAKQKAAAAEAERKRKAADEAARKIRIESAFNNACWRMEDARSSDDYRNVITAFGSIDSNDQDINNQINSNISECERKIQQMEAEFDNGLSLLREKKAKAEKQTELQEQRIVQGLCTFCGGTLKGLLIKKCSICGNPVNKSIGVPSELIHQRISLAGIEWRILDVQGDMLLLISEKILKRRSYNTKYVDITWEQCTLRKYLNGEFYNELGVAKSAIAVTHNSNPDNPWYGTSGGNSTTDKVFLLSLDEVVQYFGDSGYLKNKTRTRWSGLGGNYISSDGDFVHDQYNKARKANDGSNEDSDWWLRSPGRSRNQAAYIGSFGDIHVGCYFDRGRVNLCDGGTCSRGAGGVRPALWLKL